MMTDKEKASLRQKIKEELKKLEAELSEIKTMTRPIAPENAIGRLSRMDAIQNKSIDDMAQKNKEDRIRRLKNTLPRIDQKDFGICVKCKKPIPIGRLLLKPEAVRCVNCAL